MVARGATWISPSQVRVGQRGGHRDARHAQLTCTRLSCAVEALRDAAISTFPTVSSIRGGHVDNRTSGGYPTQNKHKGRFRKEHRAHEVAPDKEKQDEDGSSSGNSSEEAPAQDQDEFDALPEELEEDLKASSAFMTQAKKRRAEAETARGFFKKGTYPVARDERMKACLLYTSDAADE